MKILKYFELLKENKELKELVEEQRRIAILDNRTNYKLRKEIERLNNIINELDKELEVERKSRQLLTDDLAKVCEISLKKENIISKAIEYIEYYFVKGRTKNARQFDISLYEILTGKDLSNLTMKEVDQYFKKVIKSEVI